jgi:DNA-binding transcriptional MerR regulator
VTTPTKDRTNSAPSAAPASPRTGGTPARPGRQVPAADAHPAGPSPAGSLRRIHEAAAETGLTPRAIRYYEELGLLRPAARSHGAYRLYDDDDLERLRFIKGLRDDAGFSLAEIAQLLEDEAARERNRARFRATRDPVERRAIVADALARADRQIELLRRKANRLAEMIGTAEARRAHLLEHLAELERELRARDEEASAAAAGGGEGGAEDPEQAGRGGSEP